MFRLLLGKNSKVPRRIPNAQHDFLTGQSDIVTTTRSRVDQPERQPGGLSRIYRRFNKQTDKSSPPTAD